jgi:hypothetical protein
MWAEVSSSSPHFLHKKEDRIEVTRRRGRGRKLLIDCLNRTERYWNLKEETLDRTYWLWKRVWNCGKTGCGMKEESIRSRSERSLGGGISIGNL